MVGIDPGVAQDSEQVSQIIVALQESRPPHDALKGLLYEILRILARPTQHVGGSEQLVRVVVKPSDVELSRSRRDGSAPRALTQGWLAYETGQGSFVGLECEPSFGM